MQIQFEKNRDSNKHGRIVPRAAFFVALIFAFIFVSKVGGAFSYALFFSCILYIPLSFIYCLYIMANLQIYQEMEGRLLYKNRMRKYQITIENSGFIPIAGIRLGYNHKITGFKNDFTVNELKLLPGKTIQIDTEMLCKYAGNYTAGVDRIYITDMFGIYTISYIIKAELRVGVLPVITDSGENEMLKLVENHSRGLNIFKLDRLDDTNGNDMKKYVPGDSLSSVHWKNFARTGELMVRVPENKDSHMVSLVLVTCQSSMGMKNIEMRDTFLEYIVSIAHFFAKAKRALRIIYYDSGIKDAIIDNYESFQDFYLDKLKRLGGEIGEDTVQKMTVKSREIQSITIKFEEKTCQLTEIR